MSYKSCFVQPLKDKNYKVHLIDSNNLLDYLDKVPNYFFNLQPSHQADFIRVNVLYKYGGLWLDSDTIVMNDLSSLFDVIRKQNGFFIQQSDDKFNKKGLFKRGDEFLDKLDEL